MSETTSLPISMTAAVFTSGVIASNLTPFSQKGTVEFDAITHQAHRLTKIKGILGIAVNATIRERQSLSQTERFEIIRRTREALKSDQLLLACVGALSVDMVGEVAASTKVGANTVITFPPSWCVGPDAWALEDHLAQLRHLADNLPLPVIAAIGEGHPHGDSKLRVEVMLEACAEAHGLSSCALLYFNASGADPDRRTGARHDPEKHLVPLVIQTALGQRSEIKIYGTDYGTPDGTCIRDHNYVRELASGHVAAVIRTQDQNLNRASLN